MNRKFYLAVIVFIFLAGVAFSQSPPSAATWWGNVTINGANASDGTGVLAYNGSTLLAETTLGAFKTGAYLIGVNCSSGQGVHLKVYDLSASNVTCSLGVKTELNLSVNTTANGVACNYAGSCTTGFCVDSYCCNSACGGASEDCNVAGSLGTCTSTATSSTGGGGGGGGGGGAVSAPAASESQTVVGTIAAGGTADVNFAKSATLGVESIKITVKEQVSSVSVTVKETSKPAAASVAIESSSGSVYKYLDITPTVSNEKISSAKVQFKVPKTWFDTNSIDPATVVLKKNVVAGWVDLSTSQTKFDGTYYYYESTTTSFSTYAITGQKTQAAPVSNGTTPAQNGTTPQPGPSVPSFSIASPRDGALVGQEFTVQLSVSNLNIVPPKDQVTGNEGHFHFFIDDGGYIPVVGTSYTFKNVSLGQHTIRVEMHRNDHSQFDPAIAQSIKVTATKDLPVFSGDAAFWIGAIVVIVIVLGGGYWYFTRKKK